MVLGAAACNIWLTFSRSKASLLGAQQSLSSEVVERRTRVTSRPSRVMV